MNATDAAGLVETGPAVGTCRKWLMRIDWLSGLAVIGAMGLMVTLVVGQVFFRYALASSIDWAEEMARLAFVWAIFLALPHGIRSGIHVGIDVVVVLAPPVWQERLFRLSAALGAILMAVLFYYGLQVMLDSWPELMPTVDVTSAVYYIPVLIAAFHSFLHLCLLAWGGSAIWREAKAS